MAASSRIWKEEWPAQHFTSFPKEFFQLLIIMRMKLDIFQQLVLYIKHSLDYVQSWFFRCFSTVNYCLHHSVDTGKVGLDCSVRGKYLVCSDSDVYLCSGLSIISYIICSFAVQHTCLQSTLPAPQRVWLVKEPQSVCTCWTANLIPTFAMQPRGGRISFFEM